MPGYTNGSNEPSEPLPPVASPGMFSGLRPEAILIGTLVDYLTSLPLGLTTVLFLESGFDAGLVHRTQSAADLHCQMSTE